MHVDDDEALALTSSASPIVLLRRRVDRRADHQAISIRPPDRRGRRAGQPLLGVMLPYSPLHHLLFRPVPGGAVTAPQVLVLDRATGRTSRSAPTRPRHARLADLVGAFVMHDRPIHVPCDDSVVRVIDGVVQPVRRSPRYAHRCPSRCRSR
ncbi:MAG: Sua5/YciO/YrdC/YwlC family protein [Acidimicrobiales bacterium]